MMSHDKNELVTYKEEVNVLKSAVLSTCELGNSLKKHDSGKGIFTLIKLLFFFKIGHFSYFQFIKLIFVVFLLTCFLLESNSDCNDKNISIFPLTNTFFKFQNKSIRITSCCVWFIAF